MNTMKKTISIAIFVLVSTNFVNAQIKVVGDDYSSSLTGSKSYYEQDVDFEKYFPAISNKKLHVITPRLSGHRGDSYYTNLNLTGDTIYLLKDLVIESGTDVFNPSFCINHLGKVAPDTMYAGYYEVVGYVFCTENEDSVRASFGITFNDHQYNKVDVGNSSVRLEVGDPRLRRSKRADQKEEFSMKKLKEAGLIDIDEHGFITLTKEGHVIADKVYERHCVLKKLLIEIGVSPSQAEKDACKVEHVISEETFNAIKKKVK